MSIPTIRQGFISYLEGLTPSYDPASTFVCSEDGNGYAIPLERLSGNPNRHFDLRLSDGPLDDKITGVPRTRFRATFLLRVRYNSTGDYILAEDMVASDIQLIEQTVILPENFPDTVFTVLIPEQVTLTDVQNQEGDNKYLLLEMPLTVLYRTS